MKGLEIGKIYSGEEFNRLNNKKLVKIFNDEDNHKGFQYKTGLNIDTIKFNPTEECKPGGLYFSDTENIIEFFCYGRYMREILVPINKVSIVL